MADAPNSPLNEALAGLRTTINTITEKVEAGKTRVREYKAQIIAKLREVVQQLDSLKSNNNLKALPQLRKQLQDSQANLQQKTEELEQTKGQLNEANKNLQQLQQNVDQINRQIQEKDQQITDLNTSGNQNNKAIQELREKVRELEKQREEQVKNLASAQQQIDSIIQKIGELNNALVNQINLIDTIANELGELANSEVADQFNAVTDNIKVIVDMLDSVGQGPAEEAAVQQGAQQFSKEVETLYGKFMKADNEKKAFFYRNLMDSPNKDSVKVIQENIRYAINNDDQQAINNIKGELQKITNSGKVPFIGGKSRRHKRRGGRKTMKKKHKKTHKLAKKNYRGGYVYSASRDLDKASSVISASSSSKSISKKGDKTRRK